MELPHFCSPPTDQSYERLSRARSSELARQFDHATVSLSFNKRPLLAAFLYSGYSLGILKEHFACVLNVNLQIYCRWGSMEEIGAANNIVAELYPRGVIEAYQDSGDLTLRHVYDSPSVLLSAAELISTVYKLLDEGSFVYAHVDLFYIPQSAAYSKFHVRHELLIVGYDSEKKAFVAVNYLDSGVFDSALIPIQLLAEAFLSPFGLTNSLSYARNYRLTAINVDEHLSATKPLDLASIRLQLADFLNSENTSLKAVTNSALRISMQRDCDVFRAGHFGVSAYTALADYFNEKIVGDNSIDPRVTRLLWEHKRLMKVRLSRLIDENVIGTNVKLSDWDKVVQIAHGLHVQICEAIQVKSKLDRKKIRDRLFLLAEIEQSILSIVLRELG